MNREIHVRICERLGVKLPGPTRRNCKVSTSGSNRFGGRSTLKLALADPGISEVILPTRDS
jgi:hypothetical protein